MLVPLTISLSNDSMKLTFNELASGVSHGSGSFDRNFLTINNETNGNWRKVQDYNRTVRLKHSPDL